MRMFRGYGARGRRNRPMETAAPTRPARDPRTRAALPVASPPVSADDTYRVATMLRHLTRTHHAPERADSHAESLLVSLAANEVDTGDESGGDAQRLLRALDVLRGQQGPPAIEQI